MRECVGAYVLPVCGCPYFLACVYVRVRVRVLFVAHMPVALTLTASLMVSVCVLSYTLTAPS